MNAAQQRVIDAAQNLVQFLDEDSIRDQESDLRLRIAKAEAEGKLISAVEKLTKEERS